MGWASLSAIMGCCGIQEPRCPLLFALSYRTKLHDTVPRIMQTNSTTLPCCLHARRASRLIASPDRREGSQRDERSARKAETRSRDHRIVGPTPSNACSSFSPYQPCFLQSEIRVDDGLQLDPIGSWLIVHFTIHRDTRLAVGVEDRPKVNVVQSNDS